MLTRRTSRGTHALVAVAAAMCALAGCGTTVKGSDSALQSSIGQTSSGLGGPTPGAPLAGAAGNAAASGAASAPVGTVSGPGAPGSVAVNDSGTAPTTATPGATGTSSSATTTKPYKVGLLYSTNAQVALSALGAKGSIGDIKAEGDAVIAYINKHGGVGGRRLVPAWYNGDATQSSSAIATEACTAWTQDDHVDGAVPGGSIVDMNTVRECLAKYAVPAVSDEYHVQTRRQNFATSPLWAEPMGLSMESYAQTYIDGLNAQGFFASGTKLGIVYDDGPDWSAVEHSDLEPALARLGVHVAARGSYALRGFSDVAGSQSTINAMVLQFKTAGVNRVIFFEPWDGYAFFMQNADSQNFRPQYGLSSQAAFAATYATGLVPADQLKGADFVGWSPVLDRPDIGSSWPREKLCFSILHNAGIYPDGPLATAIALSGCEGLLDIAALGTSVGGDLTPANYAEALDRIHWQSALMPEMRVSAARPYGITTVRAGRWNAPCSCFEFSGPGRPAAS